MLPGGWGGICHLTRPTAGRVGAREWLSGDGEGQMMLAERVGFLVLWRVLLPRGAAANSASPGVAGSASHRYGGWGHSHPRYGTLVWGPKGMERGFLGLSLLVCPSLSHELRCRTAIGDPNGEVLHGRAFGRAFAGHHPLGGEVNGSPPLGRLTHTLP